MIRRSYHRVKYRSVSTSGELIEEGEDYRIKLLLKVSVFVLFIALFLFVIWFFRIEEEGSLSESSSTGQHLEGNPPPSLDQSSSSGGTSSPTKDSSSSRIHPFTSSSFLSPSPSSSAPPPPSSSFPPPLSSSSPPPSFTSPNVSAGVFNPLYYALADSYNLTPQWGSFKVSPDGTTAIGCNSNCSYTLCAIFRNNTQIFSITSALNPGLAPNLGMVGLAAISSYGQIIALGSWGCGSPSQSPTGYIYLFTETYYGSNVWVAIQLAGTAGSMLIGTITTGGGRMPSGLFQLSADGMKLIYLTSSIEFTTLYMNTTIQQFTTTSFIINSFSVSVWITSSVLSLDGNNLFITGGFSIEDGGSCFNQISWYQWNQATGWNIMTASTLCECNNVQWSMEYPDNGLADFNNYGEGGECYYSVADPYAVNEFNPSTSIDTTTGAEFLVVGIPSYNNYIGQVITYVYSNGVYSSIGQQPLNPPSSLPSYSLFGKQICLSDNGTYLYVTAPSSDNPPVPLQTWSYANGGGEPDYTSFTFDAIMGVSAYGCEITMTGDCNGDISSQTTTPNPYNHLSGFSTSVIFKYRRDHTGWTLLSNITYPGINGMTISCASMSNTTIVWNLNQVNPFAILNNMTQSIIPNPNQMFIPNNTISNSQTAFLSQVANYYQLPLPNTLPCPSNRYFYIDHINGNDADNGQSPETAWFSITHLNTLFQGSNYFYSGDTILFCRGDFHLFSELFINIAPDVINPNNCSVRIGAYSCGNPNEVNFTLPRITSAAWFPQLVGNPLLQWQPYNWLSLNQTTNYSVLRYDINALYSLLPYTVQPASLTFNGHDYTLPTFPRILNAGWNINSTLFSDNTCTNGNSATCPGADPNQNAFIRISPGSYCRQFVQGLFNGNDTLAISILGGNPGLWVNLAAQGYGNPEEVNPTYPAPDSDTLDFRFGNFSCSWFMNKYIYPYWGPNISMSSPFIDAVPLSIDDWRNIGQYALPFWPFNTNDGNYMGNGGYPDPTQNGLFPNGYTNAGFWPPGAPPFINSSSGIATNYWGIGRAVWLIAGWSGTDPQPLLKSWFRDPCDLYLDINGGYVYIYPCSNEDYQLLTTNYNSLDLNNPSYPVVQFLQGNIINVPIASVLEIQDLEIIGNIELQNTVNIFSFHHNVVDGALLMETSGGSSLPTLAFLIYDNIIYGGIGECGPSNYAYIVNNTCQNVISCNFAYINATVRGNAISTPGGGGIIASVGSPYGYGGGDWTGLFEHNYAAFGGITPEDHMTNFGGGAWVRYNEFSNAYATPPSYQVTRGQNLDQPGYNVAPGGETACVFLEDEEWADTNIFINCTSGGIYTGTSQTTMSNNLFINSNSPGSWGGLVLSWNTNYTYGLNYTEGVCPCQGCDFCPCAGWNDIVADSLEPEYYYSECYHGVNPPYEFFLQRQNMRWYLMNFMPPSADPVTSYAFPYYPVASTMDLLGGSSPNFGYNLMCVGLFDIVNTDTLSEEQIGYSVISVDGTETNPNGININWGDVSGSNGIPPTFLSYQSLVVEDQAMKDAVYWWGPLNDYGTILYTMFDALGVFYEQVITNFNYDFPNPPYIYYQPLSFDLYWGYNQCSCILDSDLHNTRLEIYQIRVESELDITNNLLSWIPNTYIPLIWPPQNRTWGSMIFIGQWPFETESFTSSSTPISNQSCFTPSAPVPPLPYLTGSTSFTYGNNYYIVPYLNQTLAATSYGELTTAIYLTTSSAYIYEMNGNPVCMLFTYQSNGNLVSTNYNLNGILYGYGGCSDGSGTGIQYEGTSFPFTYSSETMELTACSSPPLCLAVIGSPVISGTVVQLKTCTGSTSQQWLFGTFANPGGYH